MELIVKFKDDAPSESRLAVIEDLARGFPGLSARPLFTSDDDLEMASLVVVDLPFPECAGAVLDIVRASPVVDYAHESKSRKGM